jgi:hypothetical protein
VEGQTKSPNAGRIIVVQEGVLTYVDAASAMAATPQLVRFSEGILISQNTAHPACHYFVSNLFLPRRFFASLPSTRVLIGGFSREKSKTLLVNINRFFMAQSL